MDCYIIVIWLLYNCYMQILEFRERSFIWSFVRICLGYTGVEMAVTYEDSCLDHHQDGRENGCPDPRQDGRPEVCVNGCPDSHLGDRLDGKYQQ